ncbi:sterol carrier family protein [Corynebacterium sp. 11A]|uniref:sterol carrier family protein n=1 Tax=Corynebacterium sp. 11A TaxID=2080510 RepID=UPI00124C3BE9|nr:sterol carrier family protein [Corynebacterium sp. 11A]
MPKKIDPAEMRAALREYEQRMDSPNVPRALVARAVRLSARTVENCAPGHSVELRVPPFVAVQCIEGPRHTRGTPPNVVEMRPEVWLRLAIGRSTWEQELAEGNLSVSGTRAGELAHWVPLI